MVLATPTGAKPEADAKPEAAQRHELVRKRSKAARMLLERGDKDSAIRASASLVRFAEEQLGKRDARLASSVILLAWANMLSGRLDAAQKHYRRALVLAHMPGSTAAMKARALEGVGAVAFERGDLHVAMGYFAQLVELLERGAPKDELVDALVRLGTTRARAGFVRKGEADLRRALELNARLPDRDKGTELRIRTGLALVQADSGRQRSADAEIAKVAGDLDAALTSAKQRMQQIRIKAREAKEAEEKRLRRREAQARLAETRLRGPRSVIGMPSAGRSMLTQELARLDRELLKALGGDSGAGAVPGDGKKSRSKQQPKPKPLIPKPTGPPVNSTELMDLAGSLTEMSDYFRERGDYDRAESYATRALEVDVENLGRTHPTIAHDVTRLGQVAYKKEDYAFALRAYYAANLITRKNRGKNHPELATARQNLAVAYTATGRWREAIAEQQAARAVLERVYGKDHPRVATLLFNMAASFRGKGDYEKALDFAKQAAETRKRALGPNHIDYSRAINLGADIAMSKGDDALALEYLKKADAVYERVVTSSLGLGSDEQKLRYLSSLWRGSAAAISYSVANPGNAAAADLGATAVLRRKGRVLDAVAAQSLAARKNRGSSQKSWDTLVRARTKLARAVFQSSTDEAYAARQERVQKLEKQVADIEAELGRTSTASVGAAAFNLDAVREALPAGSALLELVVYRPLAPAAKTEKQRWGAPHYAAFVIQKDAPTAVVALGQAAAIDAVVPRLRAALASPGGKYEAPARELDQMVMRPIRDKLGASPGARGAVDVYVSPDGLLNLVPLDALLDEKSTPLVESFLFTYLGSGRELLRKAGGSSPTPPLFVANPSFGPALESAGGGKFANINFSPLPGTDSEAKALKAIYPDAVLLSGDGASKAALQAAASPSVLHIATHGFFLEDQNAAVSGSRGLALEDAPKIENPLLRSGLAFAGANKIRTGDAAGVLTALEAAALDLSGTRLVVLSACETGVGEVKNGDGVHGLRRAFAVAGAETQVLSLWKVDDAATTELMTRYYQRLAKGGGRSNAMREVRRELRAEAKTKHPYYWASFIVSGNATTLDGKYVSPAPRATPAGAPAPVEPGARGCACRAAGRGQWSWPGLAGAAFVLFVFGLRRVDNS